MVSPVIALVGASLLVYLIGTVFTSPPIRKVESGYGKKGGSPPRANGEDQ
jgi:hypothetical protein